MTGANTYLGSTTISNSNGTETVQLGNGTVNNDGSLSTSGITNNAILTYNLFGSETASYPIGGTGVLNKTGDGTLVLNASNSYSGGTKICRHTAGQQHRHNTRFHRLGFGDGCQRRNTGRRRRNDPRIRGGAITLNGGGTLTAGAGVASATVAAVPVFSTPMPAQ